MGRLLDAAHRDGARLQQDGLPRGRRNGRSHGRLLQPAPGRRSTSPAQRPAGCCLARNGERPGLRPQSGLPRRRGYHGEPAALHRDDAGAHPDLFHLQRCRVRRGGIRGPAGRRPQQLPGLLVLDSQAEGALSLGRLYGGARRSRQGEAPAPGRTRPYPHPRLLLLRRFDACSTASEGFRRGAAGLARPAELLRRAAARMGDELPADLRRQARAGIGRDRAARRA